MILIILLLNGVIFQEFKNVNHFLILDVEVEKIVMIMRLNVNKLVFVFLILLTFFNLASEISKFDCFLKPNIKSLTPDTGIIADFDRKKCVYSFIEPSTTIKKTRGVFNSFSQCVNTCFRKHNFILKFNIEIKIPACSKNSPDQFTNNIFKNKTNSAIKIKYYFNKETKLCKKFESYEGNFNHLLNNFNSEELCLSYCGGILLIFTFNYLR